MDREDVYFFIFYVLGLMWMVSTAEYNKWISGIGGALIMFGGMAGLEWWFTLKAAQYRYIEAIARMGNGVTKKLMLFCKDIDTIEYTNEFYATTLELGVPIKLQPFGKISKLVIHHQYPFAKRVIFQQGNAVYKGYKVKHSQVAHIVLHLRRIIDTDHAEPIPVFWLKDAPGDIDYPELQYLLPMPRIKSIDTLLEGVTNGGEK